MHAFTEARAANDRLASMRPSSLADWVSGKTEYTLAEWLPVYSELWQEEKKPAASTVNASDSYLRRLTECDFAECRLGDVSTQMVANFLKRFKEERGAPSAQQMRSKLKDLFRWAETQGLIEKGCSPVEATRLPAVKVARERMSLEQFLVVREHASVWLRNAMNLGLVTGQRRGDILAMKFADWREGRLYVAQGKSGGTTRLALDGEIRLSRIGMSVGDVVKSCRDLIASPYLVHHDRHRGTTKPGRRVEGPGLAEAFAASRAAAGIDAKEGRTAFTFHEIRSLSERMYREEYGPEFAQAILGHKSASTTAKYDDLRGEWKVVSIG